MIVGVGIDMVELERVGRIMDKPHGGGLRFADKVLTAGERERWAALPSRRALEFLAGRFAAKEAVVKALGCGIGAVAGFRDIEILPDAMGKPVCLLSDKAWSSLGAAGADHCIHLAITHERTMAAATAVVERIS
jgi:holo-[acyl-carrier protein] synthase